MNCKNCGTMINPNHKFCLNCGTPVNGVEAQVAPTTPVNPEIPNPEIPAAPVAPVVESTPVQPQPTPVVEPTPVVQPQPVTPAPQAPVAPVQPMMQPGPVPGTPTPVMSGTSVPQKNDNKLIFAIIGIIAVTAIIIAVMFFVLGGQDEEETGNDTNKDNEVVENEQEKEEEEEVVPPTTGSSLELGNFTYNYPTNYLAESKDDYVALTDYTYYIELMSVEGVSFAILSDEDAKGAIEDMGATVVSSQTKTFDGKNYIVVRAVYSGIDCVFMYSKSTPNYGVVGFGYKLDYTYSDDLEEEVASLANGVVYNSTASVENDVEIDLSKLGQ